ncbi:MAG: CoA transferase [Acidimicrobiia bacterium]
MRGLDGVRVLDLSTELAGAYCTKLLVDAGADVVKLEPPSGDPLRRYSASGSVGADGDEDGALFRYLCTSKSSIVGDLGGTAARLAADADLVVETYAPGVVEAGGLGIEALARHNRAANLVSISPFGRGGPRSGEATSEFLLQAWSGSIYAHGLPGRIPLAVGGRLGEWTAGAYAALGAVTALANTARTGRGAHVDVSILECLALTLVAYPTLSASFPGGSSKRMVGVMFPSVEPCKDGFVGLFVLTAQQWEMLFAMVERPDLAADADLATIAGRMARDAEVREAIRGWTRKNTVADVVERAALFRVPAAAIGNGQTLPQFEHLVARQVFVANPRGGFLQPRPPFRSNRMPAVSLRAAPRVGQDASPGWRAGQPVTRELTAEQEPRPLAGVKVLDLTAFWAGPYATLYLASAGAEVLKVESIQRPDPMRFNTSVDPSVPQWYEQGFLYHAANLGKRSITLNLGDPVGQDLLLRLAARCDVVIENFTPRVMEQFGMTYEKFVAARPDTIMVRIPAFGLDGPSRDRSGFATTMEQAAGMAWMTGYEDDAPTVPGGMCDPLTGVHAAYAVLVALEHRRQTGEGQHIEIPMIEIAANVTAEQVAEWSAYGALLGRQGNRGPLAAPQGVYACSGEEEWLAIAVASDAQWAVLVDALGDPRWAADRELDTVDGRRGSQELIDTELARWCAARTRDDALAVLADAGVPAAPVVPAARIDQDEQMNARRFWEQVHHPIVGTHAFPGWPFRLSPGPASWYRAPAPLLGEHTEEVLRRELGLDDDELARLRDQQVIGDRPVGL